MLAKEKNNSLSLKIALFICLTEFKKVKERESNRKIKIKGTFHVLINKNSYEYTSTKFSHSYKKTSYIK